MSELERKIGQRIDAVAGHQLLHLDPLRDERAQVFDQRIDALASAHDGQPPIKSGRT